MASAKWSKEDRRALSASARALSHFLDEWDPIPVNDEPGGPLPGEYDGLVWPVMRLLVDDASALDIAEELRRRIEGGYGIPCPHNVTTVATRLHEWWPSEGG